jgi:hypothetical protein
LDKIFFLNLLQTFLLIFKTGDVLKKATDKSRFGRCKNFSVELQILLKAQT